MGCFCCALNGLGFSLSWFPFLILLRSKRFSVAYTLQVLEPEGSSSGGHGPLGPLAFDLFLKRYGSPRKRWDTELWC